MLSDAATVSFVSANAVRFGATLSKVIVSRQEVSGDRSISCLVVGGYQRAPQLAWTNSAGFSMTKSMLSG